MAAPYLYLSEERWLGAHANVAAPDLPGGSPEGTCGGPRCSVMAQTHSNTGPPLDGGLNGTRRGSETVLRGSSLRL